MPQDNTMTIHSVTTIDLDCTYAEVSVRLYNLAVLPSEKAAEKWNLLG